jgi:hypothetical protein
VSEKSTKNDLDYTAKPNMVRHHFAFRSQCSFGPCQIAHEQYNSGDSELKKEVPG